MSGDRRPGGRGCHQAARGHGWREPSRRRPFPPAPGHPRQAGAGHLPAHDRADPPPPPPPLPRTAGDECACGRVCVCPAPASVVRPVASFVAEWHPAYVTNGDSAAEAGEDATRCRCGQAFCGYRRLARTLAKNGAFVRA
jgi:hypothetical protein